MDKETKQQLCLEYRLNNCGDMWGTCVGVIFDICNTLARRGDYDAIPTEWDYNSGALGPYPKDEQTHDLDEYKTSDLVEFGDKYLFRLYNYCKANGLDY